MRRKYCIGVLLALVVTLMIWACASDDSSGDDLPDGVVKLNGSVEKGPFVLGSSITISPVDDLGNPTGQQFTTQTINDLGEFTVSFEYTGPVSLEGSGFYYNEVKGALSGANLTLRAYYEIKSDGVQNAHLNLLTHLTYNRVKMLVQDGMAIDAAIAQAEDELVAALPVGPPDFSLDDPAIELTLQGGDTMQNAYLLAVSAVLAGAARADGMGSEDAKLQEIINGISADLAPDGELDAARIQMLVDAQVLPREPGEDVVTGAVNPMIPGEVMANLAERFAELGSDAVVPDLNRVLDSDFDSIVNADDNCWFVANQDQNDADDNGYGDACDIVFTDPDTGLQWQNPSGWYADFAPKMLTGSSKTTVDSYCSSLEWGGFSDWEAPYVDSLRTLIVGCADSETGGACNIHNIGCTGGACGQNCSGCDASAGPYWKTGLIGPLVALSGDTADGTSIYVDFAAGSLSTSGGALESLHMRCVRGQDAMDPIEYDEELVCSDGIDEDTDGKTDCEDSDCFAKVDSSQNGECTSLDDLQALASVDLFPDCIVGENELGCRDLLSDDCTNCFTRCLMENCMDDCVRTSADIPPACISCARQNCSQPESCFGEFVCPLEFHCQDGIDNDSDGKTDMNDADCVYLTEGLPTDGDEPDGDEPDGDATDGDEPDGDSDLPTSSPVIVGQTVTFYYVSDTNEGPIKVVGNFNDVNWDPSHGVPMTQMEARVWSATVTGMACGEYLYKFWYPPNNWIPDPLNPQTDGSQDNNSVFEITEGCGSTDGDEDGDEEEPADCADCPSLAGIYCKASQTGDDCTTLISEHGEPAPLYIVHNGGCQHVVAGSQSADIVFATFNGCEFGHLVLNRYAYESSDLTRAEGGQNLLVTVGGGTCQFTFSQTSCHN